jgi:hypothetical protein
VAPCCAAHYPTDTPAFIESQHALYHQGGERISTDEEPEAPKVIEGTVVYEPEKNGASA